MSADYYVNPSKLVDFELEDEARAEREELAELAKILKPLAEALRAIEYADDDKIDAEKMGDLLFLQSRMGDVIRWMRGLGVE